MLVEMARWLVMALLAGPAGRVRVTAMERDPELAVRGCRCLSGFANVRVIHGNGAAAAFDLADVIYVNAGVTHPAAAWLDSLADGGRLILPLTTDENIASMRAVSFDAKKAMRTGAYFRVKRSGSMFEARWLFPVAIIPAEGTREKSAEAALAAAFERGGVAERHSSGPWGVGPRGEMLAPG